MVVKFWRYPQQDLDVSEAKVWGYPQQGLEEVAGSGGIGSKVCKSAAKSAGGSKVLKRQQSVEAAARSGSGSKLWKHRQQSLEEVAKSGAVAARSGGGGKRIARNRSARYPPPA